MQCYVGKQRGILSNVLCYGVFMSKFAFETARAVRGKGHADTSLINVLKDETRNVRDWSLLRRCFPLHITYF